jgi:SRSO17 transposase
VGARHQSMHHFVAASDWSDEKFLAQVWELVLRKLGPIGVLIVDDTEYPNKGNHSVGVTRQYCRQLGKQGNCQVAVSVSVANEAASLPIAFQLYLPQEWAEDDAWRRKARVPEQIKFTTKNQMALAQLRAALKANVRPGVVLALEEHHVARNRARRVALAFCAGARKGGSP